MAFDWLSRDTAEVDKYIADPLCGFESTVQLYIDVLQGLRETAKPSRQARIPKTLPIYIFNGSREPVSDNIDQLLDAYRAAGLTQVVLNGGRLAATVWRSDDEIPFLRELRRVAERHLGPIIDRRRSYGEAAALKQLLRYFRLISLAGSALFFFCWKKAESTQACDGVAPWRKLAI